MSFPYSLFLLVSLFVTFSVVSPAPSAAHARIKGKKVATAKKKTAAVRDHTLRPSLVSSRGSTLPMEEEYLASEFEPQENEVLQKAMGLLGIRYRFGGNTFNGIDCSAFVKKVFASLNDQLPRTAREQFAVGREIPPDDMQKGDLLFFQTYAKFPSHVGIYLGDDLMIHASSNGGRVMISKMNTPFFRSRFLGARRVPSVGGFLWELAEEGDMQPGPTEILPGEGVRKTAAL